MNLLDIWLDRPPGGASGATHHQNLWTPLVFEAAATNTAQLFLGFSRFPAVQSAAESDGGTTVRWTDLRFAGRPSLFTATVRLDRQGRIVQHGFGP